MDYNNSDLRVDSNRKIEYLEIEIENLNDKNLRLLNELEYLTNLNITGAFKQLLKALYRSVRARTLNLIWGRSKSYENTDELLVAAKANLASSKTAKEALLAVNEADRKNIMIVYRHTPVRLFIYELLRRLMLITRDILGRLRNYEG